MVGGSKSEKGPYPLADFDRRGSKSEKGPYPLADFDRRGSKSAVTLGRRDTCHLTDFFQTFTVYEGR